jgi:hypothetical protein
MPQRTEPTRTSRAGTARRRCLAALVPVVQAVLLVAPAAAAPTGPPLLVDATEAVGLDFVYFNGMSGALYFAEMMGGGAALIDYDGDGDLDLFLPQGEMLGGAPLAAAVAAPAAGGEPRDTLLRNDLSLGADGAPRVTLRDVSAASGIASGATSGGYAMGVASGDIDNDGYADLYVTRLGPNRLLRNRGDGTFEDLTAASGTDDRRWSVAATFFDYDHDGLSDLYVGNYVEYRVETHRDCFSDAGVVDYCGPGAFPSESDRLFRNLGGGRFEEVTRRAGIGEAHGAGLGAVASDLDGDGDVDLFVANDGERNNLWLNQGDGTFVDEALLAGTAVNGSGHPEASMGVVVGDLDGDGFDDLFVTHLDAETNTLYLGGAGGLYDDAGNDSGLALPSWSFTGFGIGLADLDHDRDLDLYVANGAVKSVEAQRRDGAAYPLAQRNQLFRNEGGGRFVELGADELPALAASEVSRGVATGDLDADGDEDLVVVNSAGPARVLAGSPGPAGRWIGVALRGAPVLGATVTVTDSEGRIQRRRVATDGSYVSASDPRRLFGLGTAVADTLEVRWPGGRALRVSGAPAGRLLVFGAGER